MLTRSQIALILPRAGDRAMTFGAVIADEVRRYGGTQALVDLTRCHAVAAEQWREDYALAHALNALPAWERARATV